MGLAPLAGTGPLCPDRQTLGGRRNARRRPPKKFAHHRRFQENTGAKGAGRPCAAACSGEKERCLLRQTANYQLSQWDAEDRILREDFNRDNEKIDQALKELQQTLPYVKLLDVTTEAEAQQVDLDVSQIDFSPYRRFELEAEITTDGKTMRVLVNGLSEGYLYHNTNN